MKRLLGCLAALSFLSVGSYAVQVCNKTDWVCYEGGPSQNLTTYFRLDALGNVTVAGNTSQGVTGTASSSLNTVANNAMTIPVYLSTNSAVAAVAGDVITSTTSINNQVTGIVAPGTTGLTNMIGIADAAASTGTVLNVDIGGVAVALTTGTVNPGDLLVTTQTVSGQGYVATNNSAAAGAIVGVALTAGASPQGLTRILLKH